MTLIARFGQLDPVVQRDINDNATEAIVVGEVSSDRRIHLEYSLELPISEVAQTGDIVIVQDTNGVDLDHHYSFPVPELDEVVFSADVSGVDIRLLIQCISLGENPTFLYRRKSIQVV